MAPDHIAELALVEMSRLQRAAGYDFAALEAYAAQQEKEQEDVRALSGPQDRGYLRTRES
jgi:hypothetical protein